MEFSNQQNMNNQQGYYQQQGYPQQQGYSQQQSYTQQQGYQQQPNYFQQNFSNNTMPVKGWSWGAFMFSWVWGIGNHCYLPLLVFVPILNIVWIFVCGAKGHSWAMNSGAFKTVEEYNAVQRSWDRAGFVMFIIFAVIFVLSIVCFGSLFAMLSNMLNSYYSF